MKLSISYLSALICSLSILIILFGTACQSPAPTPDRDLQTAFDTQWNYIQTYLMDATHGGWYSHGLDTHPESEHGRKANIWKGSYHNGRALMRCMRLLEAR